MAFVQFPQYLSRTVALAAISAAALCATQANANTISYVTPSAAPNYGSSGTKIKTETMKFGNNNATTVYTGALWATESPSNSSFWVYCLDPLVNASSPAAETPTGLTAFLGSTSYFGNGAYTTVGGGYAKQAAATVQANLVELYNHAYADSLTNNIKSAAFQYAIWEILGETEANYGTSAGGLKATGGVGGVGNIDSAFRTQADAYLTALTTTGSESAAWTSVNGANLSAVQNYTYTVYVPNPGVTSQAFLGVVTSTNTNTNGVPEPGTGVLAAMGALAWIGVRRRKQVKNPTV